MFFPDIIIFRENKKDLIKITKGGLILWGLKIKYNKNEEDSNIDLKGIHIYKTNKCKHIGVIIPKKRNNSRRYAKQDPIRKSNNRGFTRCDME